jgi:hypothetical protein
MVNREEIQQSPLERDAQCRAGHAQRRPARPLVDTHPAGRGRPTWQSKIQDDGPGVPQALAGQIFEPFFTTKNVGEGTGLGLSLAIGIAEAHGGSLVPGSGIALAPVFRLTLPTTTMPAAVGTPALLEVGSANARPAACAAFLLVTGGRLTPDLQSPIESARVPLCQSPSVRGDLAGVRF